MMKTVLAILAILTTPWKDKAIKSSVVVSPTPTLRSIEKYNYEYFLVGNEDELELYGNWQQKKSLSELARINNCSAAINAGFYDTNLAPLGLFINSELNKSLINTSNLINGYIYYSNHVLGLGKELPQNYTWATQVGPILVNQLRIINDKPARRSVAIKTNKETVFLIVYDSASRLDGPLLAELPEVATKIAAKENWKLVTAINLDGGSASAYYDSHVYVPELTMVGSFFCKKSLI